MAVVFSVQSQRRNRLIGKNKGLQSECLINNVTWLHESTELGGHKQTSNEID